MVLTLVGWDVRWVVILSAALNREERGLNMQMKREAYRHHLVNVPEYQLIVGITLATLSANQNWGLILTNQQWLHKLAMLFPFGATLNARHETVLLTGRVWSEQLYQVDICELNFNKHFFGKSSHQSVN